MKKVWWAVPLVVGIACATTPRGVRVPPACLQVKQAVRNQLAAAEGMIDAMNRQDSDGYDRFSVQERTHRITTFQVAQRAYLPNGCPPCPSWDRMNAALILLTEPTPEGKTRSWSYQEAAMLSYRDALKGVVTTCWLRGRLYWW